MGITARRIATDAAARDALRAVAESDDRLYRARVVEVAREKASPLHRYFEWSDKRAGEQYRLLQAGRLIRLVIDARTESRAWVSLRCDQRAERDRGGYRPAAAVLDGAALQAAYEETALTRLRALRREFRLLPGFAAALEDTEQRLLLAGFGQAPMRGAA